MIDKFLKSLDNYHELTIEHDAIFHTNNSLVSNSCCDISKCKCIIYIKEYNVDDIINTLGIFYIKLDTVYKDIPFRGELIEVKNVNQQTANSLMRYINIRGTSHPHEQGLPYFLQDSFPSIDPNDVRVKNKLAQEMRLARFPQKIINKIKKADLTQGYYHYNLVINDCDHVKIIQQLNPRENINKHVFALNWKMSTAPISPCEEILIASLEHLYHTKPIDRIIDFYKWAKNNNDGGIQIVGDRHKWFYIIFDSATDAIMFKLTFLHKDKQ